MKINWRLVSPNLLDEVSIPQCPPLFRVQAENIIMLVSRLEPFNYTKMGQYDKHLIVNYWRQYDGLDKALTEPATFRDWFIKTATNPELIRRARQWLVEKMYLLPSRDIENRAQEAAKGVRQSVKSQ